MPRMYEKSTGNGEKFLYDENGKCIGRGVADKSGKTIYHGADGYAGKSYETAHGTVKHFDAKGNYAGGGVKHSGISVVDCGEAKNAKHSTSENSYNTEKSKAGGPGCLLTLCWVIIIVSVIVLFKILAS